MAVGDVWGNPKDPFDWWCELGFAGSYVKLGKFDGARLHVAGKEVRDWAKSRGYVRIVPAKKKARKT